MNHNQVADLVRTMIVSSWQDEIYDFAAAVSRPGAYPDRVGALAQRYFTALGALNKKRRVYDATAS